jgi:ribosomal protein L35
MKYAAETGSGAMMYKTSFKRHWFRHSKVVDDRHTDIHTAK